LNSHDYSSTHTRPQTDTPIEVTTTKKNSIFSDRPTCIWKDKSLLNIHVCINDDVTYPTSKHNTNTTICLSEWHANDILIRIEGKEKTYENNHQNTSIVIPLTSKLQYNETHLYAHVHIHSKSATKNNKSQYYDHRYSLLKSFRLTCHRIRKKKTDEKNLVMTFQNHENNQLAIDSTSTINMLLLLNDNPLTIASNNKTYDQNLLYLQKALYIQMVDIYSMSQLPSHSNIPDIIGKYIDWNDQEKNQYYPIVYNSHFWNGRNQLIEINDTIHEHSIDIYFDIITLWKWQIMSQMEETWEKKSIITGYSEDGVDILREMLIETNIYILIITGFVSIFHFIFDILAFKNDITFHRDRKSMEGLSKRTMIINALFQFVILLYLLDNETSNMVLLSNSVGLVIELWKIQKSIHFTFFDKNGQLNFQWNDSKSHFKSQTMIYDEIATSHLGFVTMPLVIGYGIYSLLYQKHKCWYSWILNSLVGFIYMFGFITMTPQV